jgi:hypothetical protein
MFSHPKWRHHVEHHKHHKHSVDPAKVIP